LLGETHHSPTLLLHYPSPPTPPFSHRNPPTKSKVDSPPPATPSNYFTDGGSVIVNSDGAFSLRGTLGPPFPSSFSRHYFRVFLYQEEKSKSLFSPSPPPPPRAPKFPPIREKAPLRMPEKSTTFKAVRPPSHFSSPPGPGLRLLAAGGLFFPCRANVGGHVLPPLYLGQHSNPPYLFFKGRSPPTGPQKAPLLTEGPSLFRSSKFSVGPVTPYGALSSPR